MLDMGCKSMKEYYKKIDKSFFKYGITIPKDRVGDFLCDKPLLPGESRKINISGRRIHIPHIFIMLIARRVQYTKLDGIMIKNLYLN